MAAKKAPGVVQQLEDEVDNLEEEFESVVLTVSAKVAGEFHRAGTVIEELKQKLVQELVGKGYAEHSDTVPEDSAASEPAAGGKHSVPAGEGAAKHPKPTVPEKAAETAYPMAST